MRWNDLHRPPTLHSGARRYLHRLHGHFRERLVLKDQGEHVRLLCVIKATCRGTPLVCHGVRHRHLLRSCHPMRPSLSPSLLAMFVLWLFVGCSPSNSPAERHVSALTTMPAVREVVFRLPTKNAPVRDATTLAVTLMGTVSFPTGATAGSRFVTVDSTGRVIADWGRAGEGPGESWTGYLVSADTMVVFVATSPPAIQAFTPAGVLLSDVRDQPVEGFPQVAVGDSIDRIFGQRLVGSSSILADVRGPAIRHCIFGNCERVLVADDDSILNDVRLATPRRDGLRWPPFAAERGRFVLGDGVGYRLWMFNSDGSYEFEFGRRVRPRELSAAELQVERERWERRLRDGMNVDTQALKLQLVTETIPHFGYYSMGFDERHRLWVSGWAGDSTFLDVFADSSFLGRIMVPCSRQRGALGIRGHWLAMFCTDQDDIEQPFKLKLYRILD